MKIYEDENDTLASEAGVFNIALDEKFVPINTSKLSIIHSKPLSKEDEILNRRLGRCTSSYLKNIIVASHAPKIRKKWYSYHRYIFCLLAICINFETFHNLPFYLLENGGIIFLICIIVLSFFYAVPLIFLEIYLGQFSSKGVFYCWEFAPITKGIGISIIIFNSFYLIHQNFISGLFFLYMSNSLQSNMPWYYCMNLVNDKICKNAEIYNKKSNNVESSLDQYWYKHINCVLSKNNTVIESCNLIANLKILSYSTVMLVLFIMVFFNWHLISRFVYVLVIYPLLSFIVLFAICFKVTGNILGILVYFNPNLWKFISLKTWLNAMEFVVYSMSLGYGTLITMSSYNKKKYNIFNSIIILVIGVTVLECLYSLLSFQTFRYLMNKHLLSIDDLKCYQGLNLIFVGIPEMLGQFDWSNFWTFIYFSALLILNFGRTFASMEVLFCGIFDSYSIFLSNPLLKSLIFIILFVVEHFSGLLYYSIDGLYLYIIVSAYLVGCNIFFICLFECVAVCYIYKYENLLIDYRLLSKKTLIWWWKIIFVLIVPIISISGIILKIYFQEDVYFYFIWTKISISHRMNIFAFTFFMLILLPVPLYIIIYLLKKIFINELSLKEALILSVIPKESWGPTIIRKSNSYLQFSLKSESISKKNNIQEKNSLPEI